MRRFTCWAWPRRKKKLWEALADYVRKGGGLGIIPAGDDLKTDKYNQSLPRS